MKKSRLLIALAAAALLPSCVTEGGSQTLSPEARAALEKIGTTAINVGADLARYQLMKAANSGK